MKTKPILGILALFALTGTGYAQTVETLTTNGLFEPYGVAVDLRTNLYYLTDSANNRIVKYDPSNARLSTLISFVDTNHFAGFPEGIVIARGGLVVSDSANHALYRISFDGDFEVLAGSNRGFANGKGVAAQFSSPAGLAADSEGNVFIADSKNNVIRKLALDNTVSTYATGFYEPAGVAVGSEGRVFVADTRNHTIKVIGSNGAVSLLAGRVGISGGDDGFAGGSTFNSPRALLWVGGETGLLVSDSGNDAIRRVYFKNGGWRVETFAGLIGEPGSVNGGLSAARFNSPLGLTIDLDGSILVADLYNNALRIIKRTVPPLPSVLPVGGSFSNAISITITSSAPNTVLFYTTDGTDPTPFSSVTSGTVDLDGGPVPLMIKGFSPDFATSGAVSNQYSFFVNPLALSPAGGTFSNDTRLAVSTLTGNSVTHFTTDGTLPTTNSPIWTDRVYGVTGPLLLRAFRTGFEPSSISSYDFTFFVAPPSIEPAGFTSSNVVIVSFSSATAGAELYWTINGSEPNRTNGARYTGPFMLGTNGTIKVTGFKNGYVDSQTSSAIFNLTVTNPTITPPSASSNNSVAVTLNSSTSGARLFWTIDGTEPTPSSPVYAGPFPLGTNGTLRVKAIKDGFADSQTSSGIFDLSVAAPLVTPEPGTNINSLTITLASATSATSLYWTVDASDPTTNSALYAGPFTITTNTLLKVAGYRNGFVQSPIISRDYLIQVDKPVMSPGNGFFPNGTIVTLSVARPNASIYYTLNGQDPTPDDQLYTGPFQLNQVFNQGSDLRIVKARAFAPNTLPSLIVSGQPVQASGIGVPGDVVAGIGSTVVIPLVVNLQSNQVLRTLQFRVEVSPNSPSATNLTADLRALNITGNDFVHVVGPGETGATALFNSSVYRTGNTNGLVVSAIGTNSNFGVHNFATVAMLAVTIPSTANLNDSYKIQVVQPSGTSDGQQAPVRLTPLGARSIVVSNISYVVGDSSLGTWYNAGDFGDGNLDNSDVNNAFYASLGIRVPYSFTDAFDAMDAFPDDANGAVGGDGQIRFLDWQRILSRSLRRDQNNWRRSWSAGGLRIPGNTALSGSANTPATSSSIAGDGSAWFRHGVLVALSQENVKPNSTVDVPVYIKVKAGNSLAGLQFRAYIDGDGSALEQAAMFVPSAGLPRPISLDGLPPNQVAAAWPLVPSPSFDPPLEENNLLGFVRFAVPSTARPGQCYTVHFINVDGSPDANTQYDLESLAGCVWVQSAALKTSDSISDEWRLNFFGSLTNALAQATADADGDGVLNSEEFLKGTNPTKLQFHHLNTDARTVMAKGLKLRWFAAPGKHYVVESCFDLTSANWSVIAANLMGKGDIKEFTETDFSSQASFYRVRIQP